MIILDDTEVLQAVCKAHGKWGIMACFTFKYEGETPSLWRDDIYAATGGLVDIHSETGFCVGNALGLHNGSAAIYFLFDTREEMEDAFDNRIYGDDNADTHSYAGGLLHTIRCLTCTPDGILERENS